MRVDQYGFARMRIRRVHEVTVTAVEVSVGDGTNEDPVRNLTLLFANGNRIAEVDEWPEEP